MICSSVFLAKEIGATQLPSIEERMTNDWTELRRAHEQPVTATRGDVNFCVVIPLFLDMTTKFPINLAVKVFSPPPFLYLPEDSITDSDLPPAGSLETFNMS